MWAKRAIWVGIALGGFLIAMSFWPDLGLTGVFEAMALPKMYQPWVRATIFLVGAYANIRGILSLANWTSGYRMYRKLRIPRA